MPHTGNALGTIIRERRVALGLTQEQLAELISDDDEYIRQSEISRIEAGRVALPRRNRLERLANVLGLSLVDLLMSSGWAEETNGDLFGEEITRTDVAVVLPEDAVSPASFDAAWPLDGERRRLDGAADHHSRIPDEVVIAYDENVRRYRENQQRFQESRERFRSRLEQATPESPPS